MARYIDLNELERRIKKYVKHETPEEKELIEWCKDECIRQGYVMPVADVVPKSEVENLKVINKLLEQDIADRDKMLESKVEEVHEDFMRDYKCMREELEGLYDELTELRNERDEAQRDCGMANRNYTESQQSVKDLHIQLEAMRTVANNLAREIFDDIEKMILDNTYPDFNAKHKPVNVWKATTGYDAFYELKKKYTGENNDDNK